MKNEIKPEAAPALAGGHTPLPWLLTDGLVYRDDTGRHVTQQLCHEYGRAALMLTHDGSEEGYANAELAKLACNSHAALLADRDRLRTVLKDSHNVLLAIVKKAYLRDGKHEDYHVHPALIDASRIQVANVAASLDEGGKA